MQNKRLKKRRRSVTAGWRGPVGSHVLISQWVHRHARIIRAQSLHIDRDWRKRYVSSRTLLLYHQASDYWPPCFILNCESSSQTERGRHLSSMFSQHLRPQIVFKMNYLQEKSSFEMMYCQCA